MLQRRFLQEIVLADLRVQLFHSLQADLVVAAVQLFLLPLFLRRREINREINTYENSRPKFKSFKAIKSNKYELLFRINLLPDC